jgi:hypothetical protein
VVGGELDPNLKLRVAVLLLCLTLGGDRLLVLGLTGTGALRQRAIGVLPLLGFGVPVAQLGIECPFMFL